jgi:hypothetical protein
MRVSLKKNKEWDMSFPQNKQSRRLPAFVAALAIGLTLSGTSVAQEHHESAAESHGHEFHKNLIAGFIGFTGEDSRDGPGRERALTLGIEYERRFNETFGLLLAAERALGDLDFWILTAPIVYRRGPWAFSAGPGIEIPDDDRENEFVFRLAGVYAFNRGSYELAPKAGLDFVAGEVVFFAGLVIGFPY